MTCDITGFTKQVRGTDKGINRGIYIKLCGLYILERMCVFDCCCKGVMLMGWLVKVCFWCGKVALVEVAE